MTKGISSLAVIEPGVKIGNNPSIDAFTIIRSGTRLGNDVKIGSHCEIGVPSPLAKTNYLSIGSSSTIRSHSIIYSGSVVEDKFTCGHNVIIRENTEIGESVKIGSLSDIQGDCVIEKFSRLHSSVFVGKYSQIGQYVWIFPYVVLTNDSSPPSTQLLGVRVQDFAIIAANSTVMPGVVVGFGSLIGAHSLVTKNVPPETVVFGVPAKVVKPVSDIRSPIDAKAQYPWVTRYREGYPDNLPQIYQEMRSRHNII